jgi:hypothetical protein
LTPQHLHRRGQHSHRAGKQSERRGQQLDFLYLTNTSGYVILSLMSEQSLENTENSLETKICESCGQDFSCGAQSKTCWCFEVDLSKETLTKLQEDFKSCLCRDCLDKMMNEV